MAGLLRDFRPRDPAPAAAHRPEVARWSARSPVAGAERRRAGARAADPGELAGRRAGIVLAKISQDEPRAGCRLDLDTAARESYSVTSGRGRYGWTRSTKRPQTSGTPKVGRSAPQPTDTKGAETMTRTDAQRIAAYIAKTTPTTVGLKVAAQLTGMKSGYAAMANELQPIESQITAICAADNVVSARWGQYLSFGREVWRRSKISGDPGLTTDAQLVYNKWKAYGAADTVMQHIALNVFGITVV